MSAKTTGEWVIDEETGTRSWWVKILPPESDEKPEEEE